MTVKMGIRLFFWTDPLCWELSTEYVDTGQIIEVVPVSISILVSSRKPRIA